MHVRLADFESVVCSMDIITPKLNNYTLAISCIPERFYFFRNRQGKRNQTHRRRAGLHISGTIANHHQILVAILLLQQSHHSRLATRL